MLPSKVKYELLFEQLEISLIERIKKLASSVEPFVNSQIGKFNASLAAGRAWKVFARDSLVGTVELGTNRSMVNDFLSWQ